ncbi:hypothetical protein C4564_05975 [Candidatus Microgenomates bacterium]|nr:MAG: hypothetical protein C4564_05975 [Candidatus Microgenomates bacterium]
MVHSQKLILTKKAKAYIRLSRWSEHLPFVVPLTLIGVLVGAAGEHSLDAKVILAVLANILTVSYAFMINEVEDAPDDARDKNRAHKNPIANKSITQEEAYTALRALASVSIIIYTLVNPLVFGLGITTLLLSHLYSWRKVRLKSMPVLDVVSHSLMLAGLLVLSGYAVYGQNLRAVWLIAAASTLFSVYGQLYNQLRDLEYDKLAGLKNTTISLGEHKAKILMNSSIILAIIALLTSVYFGNIPLWIIVPGIVSVPFLSSFQTGNDSRGTAVVHVSGKFQIQAMLVMNVAVIAWLVATYASQKGILPLW